MRLSMLHDATPDYLVAIFFEIQINVSKARIKINKFREMIFYQWRTACPMDGKWNHQILRSRKTRDNDNSKETKKKDAIKFDFNIHWSSEGRNYCQLERHG